MMQWPDEKGHFGIFGGRFVPETLMEALYDLEKAYRKARKDKSFFQELDYYFRHYAGRPTPLYYARRLSEENKGARIYLKREDLNHTGSHKLNNTLGQILLALRMGKKRVIAETGAGQHGVATATVAALFGCQCQVYMGEEDTKRQALNVFRMELLGAKVIPVRSGSRTLKDATNEALRDWVANVKDTYYLIGSVVGPHPYPMMVRDFQSIIGRECIAQSMEQMGSMPDYIVACVGGGSNAMGIFYPFIDKTDVKLIGVEAAGEGLMSGKHAASLNKGRIGVLHGAKSYLLQNQDGQVLEAHSISAGLDYPGVGPEHSLLKETKRAEYVAVTDDEAMEGLKMLNRTEGILPALESAHAVYYALQLARQLSPKQKIVVCLSGRGDKDVHTMAAYLKGSDGFGTI